MLVAMFQLGCRWSALSCGTQIYSKVKFDILIGDTISFPKPNQKGTIMM